MFPNVMFLSFHLRFVVKACIRLAHFGSIVEAHNFLVSVT